MAAPGLVNYYNLARDAVGFEWTLWLGLAILGLLFTGGWRVNDPQLRAPTAQKDYIGILALSAFLIFFAYLLAQVVFGAIRLPATAADSKPQFSDADLTAISVIAPSVGWVIGVLLLRSGRAVAVVGYTRKQILPGVRGGAMGFAAAMPFVFTAFFIIQGIWTGYTHAPPTEHQLLKAMRDARQNWIDVCVTLAAVVAAPLFEELLFRGCIQGALRRLINSRIIAVFITSTMFALIHDTWTIPPIFVLSLFMGFAYERKQNLWTSTTMHALFNLFNIISSAMSDHRGQ